METATARGGRRRGRWMVLTLLVLAGTALIFGLANIATQKPGHQIQIQGISDAQEIFGGVRADGDRIGSPDAPVQIQWFDDLQCSNCRDQFLSTVPTLVENYVRPGDVNIAYHHYSFSSATVELGFYGAEAAADQDYTWPYVYLFFRNQGEAKRVGVDQDFLTAIAGSIPELDVPQWRDYLDQHGGAGGRIQRKLEAYDKQATGLSIRAQPAAIVTGPNGTRTLQDGPDLGQIEAAIADVR